MLDQGRKIFRYDTFGSEAFWGAFKTAPGRAAPRLGETV
jgi:hypothetical protein